MEKQPILTYSGIRMYPAAPEEADINIADIAHALAQMARANGHFKFFYSVAQHSLACSYEAEARGCDQRICLALLLHDASEAYICDITRPVKVSLPRYQEIEAKLEKVIFRALGVGDLTVAEQNIISEIDDSMLYYEFEELHLAGGIGGRYRLLGNHALKAEPIPWVEMTFLRRYDELKLI